MIKLSQNKKIAISAFGLFVVSFVLMALFLKNSGELGNGEANVLGAGEEAGSAGVAGVVGVDFAKIVGNVKEPVVVINAEGKVQYSNSKFCEMIAVKCDKFHDVLFFDFINSKDLSNFTSTHGKLLQSGEEMSGIGPYRLLKGKSEIIVLFDAKPLINEEKKVFAISLQAKDITDKVNELNKEKGVAPDDKSFDWLESIYPKFKEIKDEVELKLMVNKLG